jgi:hypothetical protein
MEVASPKSVVRGCAQAGVLAEADARLALRMAEDRNLSVHTYNEGLADQIYARLLEYAPVIDRWPKAMHARA